MKTSIRESVARSMPDPTRPRLRPALERRFAAGEARSAVVYADIEAVCRRADAMAEAMDGVVSGEFECSPSLGVRIDEATRAARLETDRGDQ